MGAKSKPGKSRSAARKSATKASDSRGRKAATAPDVWVPQAPDERHDEIDCERIVEGYGGRSLPPYSDDYN